MSFFQSRPFATVPEVCRLIKRIITRTTRAAFTRIRNRIAAAAFPNFFLIAVSQLLYPASQQEPPLFLCYTTCCSSRADDQPSVCYSEMMTWFY